MHSVEKLCEEFGITRYELSKRCGINPSSINMLVKQNTKVDNIKVGTIRKFAVALELSTDDVLSKLLDYEEMLDGNESKCCTLTSKIKKALNCDEC